MKASAYFAGGVIFAMIAFSLMGARFTRDTVTICHATGSHSNPYVVHEPSKSGDVSGHDGHEGGVYPADPWGDIIPPFDYPGGTYPGKNWNSTGRAIYDNGCEIPRPPTNTPTRAPTLTDTPDATKVSPSETPVPTNTRVSPSDTPEPTDTPTRRPTDRPTERPTRKPTEQPTRKPTAKPTRTPTWLPTSATPTPTATSTACMTPQAETPPCFTLCACAVCCHVTPQAPTVVEVKSEPTDLTPIAEGMKDFYRLGIGFVIIAGGHFILSAYKVLFGGKSGE